MPPPTPSIASRPSLLPDSWKRATRRASGTLPDEFDEDDAVTGLDSGVKSASADHKTAARRVGGDGVSSLYDQPVRNEHPPALVSEDASSLHDQPPVGNEHPPALPDVAGSSLEIRAAFVPAVMPEIGDRPPVKARRRRSTAEVFGADGNMLDLGDRPPARDRRRRSAAGVSGADKNMRPVADADAEPDFRATRGFDAAVGGLEN